MSETVGDKIRRAFGVKPKGQDFPEAVSVGGRIAQVLRPDEPGAAEEADRKAEALDERRQRYQEREGLSESDTPLCESDSPVTASAPDGEGLSRGCVLIRAGTNKTGRRHYTREFLTQHLALFEGAFCNVDHPTRTDERDRPEGSLAPLAAVVENARYDDNEAAVVGDLRYLGTVAGKNMQAAFANATVRKRAGLSIRWSGGYEFTKGVVEGRTVQVPVKLGGDGQMFVDFVTAPTGGGAVSA